MGTWPQLSHDDMNTRLRTYCNEGTANFYSNAGFARWLSIAARDVAQKAGCVKRIIDAITKSSTRNIVPYGTNAAEVNCYKVQHVEYIPAAGRSVMLPKIDPLRLGHYDTTGSTAPQFWYEFGNYVGIEPTPDAAYNLRLYVLDVPKICHTTYPITDFSSGWTSGGTGTWTNGASNAVYAGTTGQAGTDTWGTTLTASANYTFTFTLSSISNCTVTVGAGTTTSISYTANGTYTATLTSSSGSPALVFTATMTGATGGVTLTNLYILKEVDFAASGTEQIEMGPEWQNLIILTAFAKALRADRKLAQANMIEAMVENEIAFLRQNIVEVIPDGTADLTIQ